MPKKILNRNCRSPNCRKINNFKRKREWELLNYYGADCDTTRAGITYNERDIHAAPKVHRPPMATDIDIIIWFLKPSKSALMASLMSEVAAFIRASAISWDFSESFFAELWLAIIRASAISWDFCKSFFISEIRWKASQLVVESSCV